MAKVYMITEAEAKSLLDSLELHSMRKNDIGPREESQMVSDIHRSFHYVCVNWLQEMGFKGY